MVAADATAVGRGHEGDGAALAQLFVDESYRMGQWVSRSVLGSEDAREGPRAFAEKRPAVWQGR